MRIFGTGLLTIITALVSGCVASSSPKGSYIYEDPASGMMIDFDDGGGKTVSGSMTVISADQKGKINAVKRFMSGTIDHGSLNLSVENGSGISLVTGKVISDGLELIFFNDGDTTKLKFAKRPASDFDTIIGNVRKQSAEVKQEKVTADIDAGLIKRRSEMQNSINALSTVLLAASVEIASNARKVNATIAGYSATAKRASELKVARRGLRSTAEEGSYRIDDINYRLTANQDTANSAHSDFQDYVRRIADENSTNDSKANVLVSQCTADTQLSCSELLLAVQKYNDAVAELRTAVAKENGAFEAQRGKF